MADGKLVFDTGLDDSGFKSDAKNLEKEAKSAGSSIGDIIKGMISADAIEQAFTSAIGAVKQFIGDSIAAASDLQEVQNVVDVTFGKSADRINAWAQSVKSSYGLSELQAKQFSGTIGAMLTSSGVEESAIYSMSTSITELTADMASFFNLDFDTAFQKLRSGLSGETEPLKQLGINMSVANMEAFALAQGITESWESMSQSEQTMLRYQYLMQQTAKVQGDFARTSDGYANALRTLEVSWGELKTNVGEFILPIAQDVVNALNSVMNGILNANVTDPFKRTMQGFKDTTKEAEASADAARVLVDRLDAIANSSDDAGTKQAKFEATLAVLKEVAPEVAAKISTNTTAFNEGKTAIYNYIQALEEEAKAEALNATKSDIMKTVTDETAKSYELDARMAVANRAAYEAKKSVDSAMAEYNAIEQHIKDLNANTEMSDEEYDAQMDSALKAQREWYETYKATGLYDTLEKDYLALSEEAMAASEAAMEQREVVKNVTEAAQKELDYLDSVDLGLNKAAEADGKAAEGTQALADGADGASTALEGEAGSAEDATKGLKTLTKAAEESAKQAKELQKSYEDTLQDIQDRAKDLTESVVSNMGTIDGAFEKTKKVSGNRNNLKKYQKNAEANLANAENYNANLEYLQNLNQSGVISDDFLSSMATGTAESMQMAADMVAAAKKNEDQVAKLSDTYDKVIEASKSVADTAGSILGNTDEQMQALIAKAENLKSQISDQVDEIHEEVNDAVKAINDFSGEEGAATLKVVDEATETISKVAQEVAAITGTHTIRFNVLFGGKGGWDEFQPEGTELFTPEATGMDYVPYNGFLAQLHEGEAVLRKSQANLWRAGIPSAGYSNRAGAQSAGTVSQTFNFNQPITHPNDVARMMFEQSTYGMQG